MDDLHQYIKNQREPLCDFLGKLVHIPTVNPPGDNYAEIVDVLDEHCQSLGMATQILSVPTEDAIQLVPHAVDYPRMNLVARWDVGATETVHFNAHYDVVPVSGGWKHDPFSGEVSGEWLYGRGSNDMKDSIAALLFAISVLKAKGITPALNIECSFTCDEETGGDLGAGYIATHGGLNADYVVNCEGSTGLDVGCGHNGVVWFEVTVHGKAAHASRPDKGINAFEKAAELTMALQPLKERFSQTDREFWTPSDAKRQPTMNIGGVVQGTEGDKVNTVPAQLTFSIDRRILPNETLETAESELRDAIEAATANIPDAKVDIRRTLGIEPCLVAPQNRLAEAFARAVRKVRRQPTRFNVTTGFTDLHFLVDAAGCPGVGYGPKGAGGHGANERVHIPDLIQTTRIYAEFMRSGVCER